MCNCLIQNIQVVYLLIHAFLYECYHFLLQIYTDFDEIRQEIENETERISGNNKVRQMSFYVGDTKCLFVPRQCC